jgi:hygromycin-B 7''-O-kinase
VKLTVPDARWQIEAKARHAARVHGRLSLETPAALAAGALDGWPYVVLTRVAGVAIGAAWPELDHAERLRLAGALGRLARELHGLDAAGEPDDWDAFRSTCLARLRARRENDVPPALAAEVAPFLAAVGELAHAPRVRAHTELLDQHVLVEPRDGRYELAGLIDFADPRLAPEEYEFPAPAELLFRAEPGLFRAFLLAYGYAEHELTPDCSERLLAWGLTHRYGSLARMLRAVAPARPGTLAELAGALYPLAAVGAR